MELNGAKLGSILHLGRLFSRHDGNLLNALDDYEQRPMVTVMHSLFAGKIMVWFVAFRCLIAFYLSDGGMLPRHPPSARSMFLYPVCACILASL